MRVPPPSSTLFPYTTLFRSVLQVLAAQLEQIEAAIAALEKQLMAWHKTNAVSQRLASIPGIGPIIATAIATTRSEEHTSELQSHSDLVCRLLLEKKKKKNKT